MTNEDELPPNVIPPSYLFYRMKVPAGTPAENVLTKREHRLLVDELLERTNFHPKLVNPAIIEHNQERIEALIDQLYLRELPPQP